MKSLTSLVLLLCALSGFSQNKKVLIVSTNTDTVGTNASGTYLMEIAFPFQYFTDKGYDVDIVTAKGGKAAIYGKVTPDLEAINNSKSFIDKTTNTLSPKQVRAKDYTAIFYPGGHGQYYDVVDNEKIASIAASIYENGGVLGTAGHGAASLINIKLKNGKYLVDGVSMTAFPHWAELKFMNISDYGKLLAFDMEVELTKRNAKLIVCTEETRPNKDYTHIVDTQRKVVTGAFATSAQWVAEQMVLLIEAKKL